MLGRVGKRVGNPLAGKEHLLHLEKAVLANTLEQFVVYFVTSLASLLHWPEMKLIAHYAVAFTVGRVVSWYVVSQSRQLLDMCSPLATFLCGGHPWYGIETSTSDSTTGPDTEL